MISVDMASLMEKVRDYDEVMQQKAESVHVDDIDG